jgi:quinol---cytochrome c reductase iron-sulfur subunit
MSGTAPGPGDIPPDEAGQETEESRAPHRVIGTPPPARARTLLGEAEGNGSPPPPPRELPAEPDDPVRAKRAERVVAACFTLSMLASIGFIAAYVALPVHSVINTAHSNLWLGIAMSVAFTGLAVGAVVWVRQLMPHVELTEARKPMASSEHDRAEFAQTFTEGAEASGFVKRPLVRRTLIGASLLVGVAPLVTLRDMGPLPRTSLRHTVWRSGMRLLVYGPNTPLRPADFATPGQMITVVPAGFQDNQDALAKATTIIIKFAPGELQQPTNLNWTVNNIVAYSKICTHVGCPVALYEHTTHHILCPCHQSTFDATRGAAVVFGPAARPLPQLPIGTDAEGYLIATSDYDVPVGPSFWERG